MAEDGASKFIGLGSRTLRGAITFMGVKLGQAGAYIALHTHRRCDRPRCHRSTQFIDRVGRLLNRTSAQWLPFVRAQLVSQRSRLL